MRVASTGRQPPISCHMPWPKIWCMPLHKISPSRNVCPKTLKCGRFCRRPGHNSVKQSILRPIGLGCHRTSGPRCKVQWRSLNLCTCGCKATTVLPTGPSSSSKNRKMDHLDSRSHNLLHLSSNRQQLASLLATNLASKFRVVTISH